MYIGIVYTRKGDYKKAIEYFNQGIEFALKSKNKSEYAFLLINKSTVYYELGDYLNGIDDIKEALKVSREIGHIQIEYSALYSLGTICIEQGMYQDAIDYFDSVLIVLENTNSPQTYLLSFNKLYSIYETLGDYKNAFHYQTKYIQLKDSLYSVEKMETINNLELKYQKKENEAKILVLENENLKKDLSIREKTTQRNIISYTALGIFLFLILLFAFYRQRINKNRIIAEQQIKQLEEEKKLLAARSLVEGQEEERKRIAKDLHDGIGVLLSTAKMQFTALKDKNPENKDLVDKAGKLLEQASVDVRRISHNMMPGLLTKYGLNEALADLFEQLDETPGLSAKMDTNEESKRLVENQEIMLYRIVQELVNNTLKHAVAKNISLNLNYTDDILKLHYADDGVGFEIDKQTENISIGLKGIESRVSFLSGEVNMESETGGGFRCYIEIPVEYV
ncbi:MAG: tetratricopeptide repeat protein [Chlorobi bacterium]|nr:tetratricopeptide repeat protein [Chlorobiota bacterium]